MSERDMAKLIALLEKTLGANWRDVVDWLRTQNSLDDIEMKLTSGDLATVVRDIESAAQRFAADTHQAYVTSGQTETEWLDRQVPDKLIRFDQANTRAVSRARQNELGLVRGLVQEQRAVIQNVLVDGMQRGINPREMARDIRSSIGLTEHQASAVLSYRRALESGDYANALGRELRDARADRTLLAGKELTPEKIDSLVERYERNFIAYRAETIARTEALRAAHEGSEDGIRQAIERGDIEADQLVREWIAGPAGPNAREQHRAMHGQQRKHGEAFEAPDGTRLMYPGDPAGGAKHTANCRCAVATTLEA